MEGFAADCRLLREDVDRGPAETPSLERRGERVQIDDRAAAVVDEEGPRLHRAQLLRADHTLGHRRLGNVQAYDVAPGEERLKRLGGLGVAVPQLVGQIVEDHPHPHRLGRVESWLPMLP